MNPPIKYSKAGRDSFILLCKWYTLMQQALYFYEWKMYDTAMERQFEAYAVRDDIEASTPLDGQDWLTREYLYRLGEPL
jgi:hypothetical protein